MGSSFKSSRRRKTERKQPLCRRSEKEADIEQVRDRAQALDESINDLQQVLLLASEDLEKLEGRKEVLKERKKTQARTNPSFSMR